MRRVKRYGRSFGLTMGYSETQRIRLYTNLPENEESTDPIHINMAWNVDFKCSLAVQPEGSGGSFSSINGLQYYAAGVFDEEGQLDISVQADYGPGGIGPLSVFQVDPNLTGAIELEIQTDAFNPVALMGHANLFIQNLALPEPRITPP